MDPSKARRPTILCTPRLHKNFVLRAFSLGNYVGPAAIGLPRSRATKFIYGILAAGKLKPVIGKTFPFSEIREAHRYMESNQQVGKIVVRV
jgi:NADPH:quinone reductase-like Zn-dependent oxidoreductase